MSFMVSSIAIVEDFIIKLRVNIKYKMATKNIPLE